MTIIRHDFKRNKPANGSNQREKPIPGFQLRITLSYSSPPIWRTVVVPGTLSLAALHGVIQVCFGWPDEATHRFLVGKIFYSPEEAGTEGSTRSSARTKLHELEKDMGFIFSYLYDGGSGWDCEITPEQLLPDSKDIAHPALLAAEGACPPPSIDDIHTYQDLLARLQQPGADREKILAGEGISPAFDPEYCDRERLNEELKQLPL